MDDIEEPRIYFGRQKPCDEYAFGVIQDTYERKLNNIIDNRGKGPEISVKSEIKDMVCSQKTKRVGYFKNSKGRRSR